MPQEKLPKLNTNKNRKIFYPLHETQQTARCEKENLGGVMLFFFIILISIAGAGYLDYFSINKNTKPQNQPKPLENHPSKLETTKIKFKN